MLFEYLRPDWLFQILFAAIVLGGFSVVATVFGWHRGLQPAMRDWVVKTFAKLIQLVSGYVTVSGAYAVGAEREVWHAPATAGIVCIVVWEIAAILAEARVRSADKLDRGAAAKLTVVTDLLFLFRKYTNHKSHRVRRELRSRPTVRVTIDHVRQSLTPEPHLEEILEALGVFLRRQRGLGEQCDVRLGVYVVQGNCLEPVQTYSLAHGSGNPFSSFESHPEFFRTDNPDNPSLAVRCIREKRMLIVEDCATAEREGKFRFFSAEQKEYLKSILAYPIGTLPLSNRPFGMAALMLDSDEPGFFRQADARTVDFYLQEFLARIRLEMNLLALTNRKGRADGSDQAEASTAAEHAVSDPANQAPAATPHQGHE